MFLYLGIEIAHWIPMKKMMMMMEVVDLLMFFLVFDVFLVFMAGDKKNGTGEWRKVSPVRPFINL